MPKRINDAPTMGMRALLTRIERSAIETGIKDGTFALDWKRNAKGDLVVALIIPEGDGRHAFSRHNVP